MAYTEQETGQGVWTMQPTLNGGGQGVVKVAGNVQVQRHIDGAGSIPTIAADGTVAAAASIYGSDLAGIIYWNSGTGAIGAPVVVTFGTPFTNVPFVSLTPAVGITSTVGIWATASTATFTVHTAAALVASVAAGGEQVFYQVMGFGNA